MTISKGIVKGETYRFRYRAKNKIGWGDYSDIGYILAAQEPSKPNAPTLVSASDTEIDLSFDLNVENGGSTVLDYSLEYNLLNDDEANFAVVASYDGVSSTHTLD
jgi:hypothetical protein